MERPITLRVAIVHHWFVTRGGGERVAECLAALFPQAELFTLVAAPPGLPDSLKNRTLHTSFLQKLPFGTTHHRHMMPLYPAAAASLDLRAFDLVLSSDSGPVKGIRLSPHATHICYCHSPMRYLYDGYEAYRDGMKGLTRAIFSATAGYVRRRDLASAAKVTYFLSNSNYVAARIQRFYHRDSRVIHPPIDLHRAVIAENPGAHYLAAGRLVPYKRTELMIEACNRLGRPLRVSGTGPEIARLKKIAGPTVTFLGELSTVDLWREYSQCRALLFAADEDFGMVPLEAQACGRPVIAYGAGGSLETVSPTTGVFFPEQTAASLEQGILDFEGREASFIPKTTQLWAETFATPVFLRAIRDFVLEKLPSAANEIVPAADIDRIAGAS
ncbi:Glycosyltransferase involved in cell wall bisynthesis [Granulicella pectinivorans]|uniref:Glycosyltransferase involved in cell wall bisynthesis n=1 Tax=Granulicella pectinivorans TaxID=474950 RepID=A0A1I6LMW7_9BACT|nr:glycosyltransferase [Granulicella pectinivorans]SFS04846.1 Glycosyltransferase involved in cell wall bisynthesis [Granulicella pectinivorans]